MDKEEARQLYDSALKWLRSAQDSFASILVRNGATYTKHPVAPSHSRHVLESLKDAQKSLEKASEAYEKAYRDAKRAGVTHPGDKYGGKLVKGEPA